MAGDATVIDALGRLVPSLGVILLSLGVFRWWMRRGGRVARQPTIRVVARTGLSRNATVAVVAVDDQRFLVGATDQQVQLLAELAQDAQPAQLAAVTPLDRVPAVGGHDLSTAATEAVTERPGTGASRGLAGRLQMLNRRRTTTPIGLSDAGAPVPWEAFRDAHG